MTHSFKGTDYSELHLALGLKFEDDMEVDLPNLQGHLNAMFTRYVLLDEDEEDSVRELSRETELCRGYVQSHIDHLRAHKCISASEDRIAVYEAAMRVKEPDVFIRIVARLIDMMWC